MTDLLYAPGPVARRGGDPDSTRWLIGRWIQILLGVNRQFTLGGGSGAQERQTVARQSRVEDVRDATHDSAGLVRIIHVHAATTRPAAEPQVAAPGRVSA